jgi:hypothetical protein
MITSNPPTSLPLKTNKELGEYAVGRKIGLERVNANLKLFLRLSNFAIVGEKTLLFKDCV